MKELMSAIRQFTEDRDWDQFHNGKDLALALSIEAAELNEAFLWKDAKDVKLEKVREELADVFNYAFLIADKYDLDVREIVMEKLSKRTVPFDIFFEQDRLVRLHLNYFFDFRVGAAAVCQLYAELVEFKVARHYEVRARA